ncbi:class I SAM-dependent methyltransferase [bacterium]|nr:class I SAM-dependent methyltransferase [bacterium]
MKTKILTRLNCASETRVGLSVRDRLARALLHRTLRGLRGGRLTVVDTEGSTTFGALDTSSRLEATVHIRSARFYRRALRGGSLGVAESYLSGDWDCDDLVALFRLIARNDAASDRLDRASLRVGTLLARVYHRLRKNTKRGSRRNIHDHYDLGNEFFRLFLDPSLTYSCGLFVEPDCDLERAQWHKLDRICRKLALVPSDHVLEIGTGWGSFAIHAARHYGCRVTTTTISRKQYQEATRRVREAGLSDRVDVLLRDYRELSGSYDKLVSIEMIEAVGAEYWDTYFRHCARLLKPDGVMLIQGITMADRHFDRYRRSVDFIQRYVFPGSCLLSLSGMTDSLRRTGDLGLFHLEEIGPHYATTLHHWRERFDARLADVREMGFDESSIRLFHYYFAYCLAGFTERTIGTVQAVMAKPASRMEPILPPLAEREAAA